jgi:hypothetical protein
VTNADETEAFRLLTDVMIILQIQEMEGYAVVDLRGYFGETSLQECGRKISKVDQHLINSIMPGVLNKTPMEAMLHVRKVWERHSSAPLP